MTAREDRLRKLRDRVSVYRPTDEERDRLRKMCDRLRKMCGNVNPCGQHVCLKDAGHEGPHGVTVRYEWPNP